MSESSKIGKARLARFGGALSCLVPLIWFSGNTVINANDFSDPFNPGLLISQTLNGWTQSNLGQSTFRDTPLLFPYDTFWWIFRSVGLSASITQRLWFVSVFLLGYLSALHLFAVITRGKKVEYFLGPSVAILFLFNPFTLSQWSSGHDIGLLAYYSAPLWLAELYKLFTVAQYTFKQCFSLALISLLFAPSFIDMSAVSTVVLPSLMFLVLCLIFRKCSWRATMQRVGVTGALIILLNIWWIGPMLANLGSGFQYAGSSSSILTWPNFSVAIPFVEFLRGGGFWGYYTGYQGVPYYRFGAYLHSPVARIATNLVVLLVPLAVVWLRRSKWVWFALVLYLVGVDLASALNGPLGILNRWLFLHVPGIFVFRSTHQKFEGLVFLAVLISGSVLASKGLRSGVKGVAALVLVICAFTGIAPMINGEFRSPHLASASIDLHIPNSYSQLLKWTAAHNSEWPGEMLVLPQLGYVKTAWGLVGGDILPEYSKIPTLIGSPGQSSADGPLFAATIEAAKQFTSRPVLNSLGIDLILVRSDINTSYYPGTPTSNSLNSALTKAGFPVVARFGYFRIYAVSTGSNAAMAFSSVDSLQQSSKSPPSIFSPTPTVSPSVSGLGVTRICSPTVTLISVKSKEVGVRCGERSGVVNVKGISSQEQALGTFSSTDYCGGATAKGLNSFASAGPFGRNGAVTIESSGGHACIISAANHISTNTAVRLSFAYKWVSGAAPRFVLLEPQSNTYLADVTLPKSRTWRTDTIYAETTPGTEQLSVFLYADASTGSHTVETYADVNLASVTLKKSLSAFVNADAPPPIKLHVKDVVVKPLSVTGTIENVRGSAWLTLPYSSDANWHLTVSSPDGRVHVLRHEVIDGFLTGWQVSGSGAIHFIATASSPWTEPLLIMASFVTLGTGIAINFVETRKVRMRRSSDDSPEEKN